VEVTCTCGKTFEARHPKARYCSDRCRKRKGKAEATVTQLPTSEPVSTGVEAATTKALTDVSRLDSPLGQACLVLARRLDRPGLDTGSAVAAVAKQLEAMLASATRGAGGLTSPQQLQDELAERRRKHGA
jgi:hypothetical protein